MGNVAYSETEEIKNVFGKAFLKWIEATDFTDEQEKTLAFKQVNQECTKYFETLSKA